MKGWDEYTRKEQKLLKKILKESYKRSHRGEKPKTDSLMEEPRCYSAEDDYEYWTEYGFLGFDLTDEEVEEMVDDMRMVVNSPYDCTGRPFTCWISTHRNPSGLVSFIHRLGLDV